MIEPRVVLRRVTSVVNRRNCSSGTLEKSGTERRTAVEIGGAMHQGPFGYGSKLAAPCYL
jgi:hypothetical protein